MVICYLGVGSNLGKRKEYIKKAIRKIGALKDAEILKVSGIIETNPVGGPSGQGKFLNAALKIKTSLPPQILLKELQKIEKELGRVRTVRYGPRTIDLDILFYDSKVINRKNLKVPHPRIFQRDFVLKPLSQLL